MSQSVNTDAELISKDKFDENANFEFKRQAPIEELDDDEDEECGSRIRFKSLAAQEGRHEDNPVSVAKVRKLNNDASDQVSRIDEDGTEYEWDKTVKGWFPKVSDNYLVEHHLNYGVADPRFKFDPTSNCFTYELTDGSVLRLDTSTNQWIPKNAVIEKSPEGKITFMHPLLNIRFILRDGLFEPADQSHYLDTATKTTYIWSREQKGFVDERFLSSYVDVVTGLSYQKVDTKWILLNDASDEAVDLASNCSATYSQQNNSCEDSIVQSSEGWLNVPDEKNRNVYVSNIPEQMTDEDFHTLMCKYGLIADDTDSTGHRPRVKLYKDANGNNKGDGLCTYAKVESVDLCLKLLDGSLIDGKTIRAERAQFQPKGSFDPTKRKRRKRKDASKANQRLFGWDDDSIRQSRPKSDRILVIRNIIDSENRFMPFAEISAIKKSIRELFKTYAPVKDVRIFPNTGVVTVGLACPSDADKCLKYINGRLWGDGRTIDCQTWDGRTKYDVDTEIDESKESQRIENWHRFLTDDNERDIPNTEK